MARSIPSPVVPGEDDEVDAFVLASRALLGIATRSLEPLEGRVSPAQFRLLLVLSELGTTASSRAAAALGVAPSTVTRLADRLERSRHLARRASPQSRSIVCLELTGRGHRVVSEVLQRRSAEIARVLERLPADQRQAAAAAMAAFAAAAGEGHGSAMLGPR